MPASLGKRINKDKFKDPNWYTSLAVDLLDLKWGGVAKELSKALKPAKEPAAVQLAKIFVDAFNNAQINTGVHSIQVKLKKEYTKLFLTGAMDPDFPSHHPLFSVLLNEYKEARREADFNDLELAELNDLKKTFSASFDYNVNGSLSNFPEARQYLKTLRQSMPTETMVLERVNEVLFEVEHAPLPINQRMTLRKSYVSPACESGCVKVTSEDSQSKDCLIKELVSLIESNVDPIIIHGQPGHGKTSSVKMLFRTVCSLYAPVSAPPIPLLFEFKHLHDLNRSACDVLRERAKFISSEDFFLGRNTLLILDGLDERQAAEGGSDDFLKNFIRDLFNLARRVNQDDKSRLNLVLTGRSQYVGQIKSAFTGEYNLVEIQDFDETQQKLWLGRFNQQTAEALGFEQFETYKLNELVGQPILLAVSALMLSDKEGKALLSAFSGKQLNRAMIYQTIIAWSYNKNWHKEKYQESWKDDISFEDYLVLLQSIAFEMYRAGEETIRLSDLTTALKTHSKDIFRLECIGDKWLNNLEELLKQLRISFFFTGVEDKAFSFIHKSLKDFLIASGLVDASKTLFKEFNERRPEHSDDDLVALFGTKALSEEDHCGFLRQWLAIRKSELDEFVEPAFQLSRRVISGEFSIDHVHVAQEQNRKFAIVTHNLLQMVCRWFCLPGVHVSTTSKDEIFNIFEGDEQAWVVQRLNAHDMNLKVFDRQRLHHLSFFGSHMGSSLFDCDIDTILVSGQVTDFTFKQARINYLHFFSGSMEFCDLSGESEIVIFFHGHLPVYFYHCDFSGRKIRVDLMGGNKNCKPKFINCNFEGVTFDNPDEVEIIEQDGGFQPLTFNIQ